MKWFLDVLRGMVIGLANVIPGVSGGAMMVAMGIYDKIIWCINHLLKSFKKCFATLLPYGVGMVIAILMGAVGLKMAFARFPLPTNVLFIGLILGSLPFIFKKIKGEQIGWQGVLAFVLAFAIVIGLRIMDSGHSTDVELNAGEIVRLFLLGMISSATMVGISSSMLLKTLGYYEVIVTGAIPAILKGLTDRNWPAIWHNVGILVPFGIGVVVGVFVVAKLIAIAMEKWKGRSYCAILGVVAASPVVILMDSSIYEGFNAGIAVASVIALAVGFFCSLKLGGDPEPEKA
ncbi:MAG: DUF368 domain-containing protein [Clostridia bacterium]|nr:DUF368 domain-containing protein [Clostridia bacterium]